MSSFNKDGLSPLRAATSAVGVEDNDQQGFDGVGSPETSSSASLSPQQLHSDHPQGPHLTTGRV